MNVWTAAWRVFVRGRLLWRDHLPYLGLGRFAGSSFERLADQGAVREIALNPARTLTTLPKTVVGMGARRSLCVKIRLGVTAIKGEHFVPSDSILRYKSSTAS